MALTSEIRRPPVTLSRERFALTVGNKAYKGGIACLVSGKVVPGSSATGQFRIGHFFESVDATSVEKNVVVELDREIVCRWFANAGAPNAVAATDVGSLCYVYDDTTVTITSTSRSVAGRVWAVDSTKGVLVETLYADQLTQNAGNIAANQVAAGTAYQVLRTNAGATASEWGRVIDAYAAVNATNDVTIQISQGKCREITAAGDGKNVTVATTGAVAGDVVRIVRKALGASTATNIVNGGTGAGTLMAQTANKAAGCEILFNGTDWLLVSSFQAS